MLSPKEYQGILKPVREIIQLVINDHFFNHLNISWIYEHINGYVYENSEHRMLCLGA